MPLTPQAEAVTQLICALAAAIVGDAKKLRCQTDELESLLAMTLAVPPDDYGKLIGKAGRTIKPLLRLSELIGRAYKHRVKLIVETPPTQPKGPVRYVPQKWDATAFRTLLERTAKVIFADRATVTVRDAGRTSLCSIKVAHGALDREGTGAMSELFTEVFGAIGKTAGHAVIVEVTD